MIQSSLVPAISQNRQWRLVARPIGLFKESDFEWREEALPVPRAGQLVVRNVYLSLDPASRGWAARDSYLPAVPLGEVMRGVTLGIVQKSLDPGFAEGDWVQGLLGWQLYALADGAGLTKLPRALPIPMLAYFGALGHIGLTAYFGLLDIGQPKSGETLVVTAAAGAVGSLAGQIGKLRGCRVVGIAGADEKCRWIREELGFDAAINYKTENLRESLAQHCPQGIDVDFENVGGSILDAILERINLGARLVICGLISQYNATEPAPGPYNFANILIRRARVQGFIVTDYAPRFAEATVEMAGWIAAGKLKYRVEVVEGLEQAPRAVQKLFDGSNQGKLIVKVSEP